MRAYDLIELAGRNLREAGLRNSLTTLGIGVGVASLVAMLSLGIGLQKLATRQLGRSGLFDTVVVTSRQDSRGPRFAQAAPVTAQAKPLDDVARHSFEQMPNVAEVYPNFSAVGDVRLETDKTGNHFTVVGTLPQSARTSEAFDDVQGSFFSSGTAEETIILGDFGRDLLNLPREPRGTDVKLTPDQANQLLGKYIVLRYHKREAGESAPLAGKTTKKGQADPDDVDSADDKQGRRCAVIQSGAEDVEAEDCRALFPASRTGDCGKAGRRCSFRWRWRSRWTWCRRANCGARCVRQKPKLISR